jgi:hypothetical protein
MFHRSSFRLSLAALAALLIVPVSVHAGYEMKEVKQTVAPTSPFDQGQRELQIGAGAFFSFGNDGKERPTMNDADLTGRIGWMLNTPSGDGFFRGNVEFLTEVFGAGIFEGPGSVIGGVTLLLRYNFVQPDARWVPYFQLGAGGAYSDAHEETPQRRLGSALSFNLQGGFGLRFFCTETCAIFLEADYRHLSNASLADRNNGLNSVGGFIGASYFF